MLNVQIPKDRKRLERSITVLEWQLSQDSSEKDKIIHMQALEALKRALDDHIERYIVERKDSKDDANRNDRIDYPGTAFRVF